MKKGWKFIGVMFLIILFLAGVCAAVGFLTGGDVSRIWQIFDNRFDLTHGLQVYSEYFRLLWESVVVSF